MRGSCDEDSFNVLFVLVKLFCLHVLEELPGLGDQEEGQRHQEQHGGEAEGECEEVDQGLGCLLHSDKSQSLGILLNTEDLRNCRPFFVEIKSCRLQLVENTIGYVTRC